MSSQQSDQTPLHLLRNRIAGWLTHAEWQSVELIRWLQGNDIYLPGEDDPYVWILRALPPGGNRYQAEGVLAERLSVVLDTSPDVTRPGWIPEKLLYNLFMLCAGLSNNQHLAEPLYKIFQRRALSGAWRGVDLRSALRDALIENQIDNRLENVWLDMCRGAHEYLLGNIYDALEGIRLMPSGTDRGIPALNAIGQGLEALAEYLERDTRRRQKLRKYIRRVMESYPGRPTWTRDLIAVADRYRWPDWAVECLPSLCIQVESGAVGGAPRFLLWEPVAHVLREKGYLIEPLRQLCNSQVVEVRVTTQMGSFIHHIAPFFERNRKANPWPSTRAGKAVVTDTLTELELMAGKGSPHARPFYEARQEVLKNNSLSLGAISGRYQV